MRISPAGCGWQGSGGCAAIIRPCGGTSKQKSRHCRKPGGDAHAYSQPTAHITYTVAMASTPFTRVTPPNEMSADRSGMRDSDVHTQK